jgi:hypothetical protein
MLAGLEAPPVMYEFLHHQQQDGLLNFYTSRSGAKGTGRFKVSLATKHKIKLLALPDS